MHINNNIFKRVRGERPATRLQISWVCFLIFSLAYELPLVHVTSFDRVNPRLFDLATLLGALFILPHLYRSGRVPELVRIWLLLVVWFVFCALLWATFWLPWSEAGRFSLYYAFRYVQGAFVIYLAVTIRYTPEQKKILHHTVVFCGVFLAIYAIPEYLRGDSVRYLSGGKVIHYASGTILGPLGSSYDHISGWSALAFSMSLSMVRLRCFKRTILKFLIVAGFVAWPALVAGSRTGLLSIVLIFFTAQVFLKELRSRVIIVAGILSLCLCGFLFELPAIDDLRSSSRSFERLLATEERGTHNTILDRIGVEGKGIQGYTLDMYEWQGWRLPLFGGGFYAVAHVQSGRPVFRIGYGVHNGYLFPLEQAGFLAFVLFIIFIIVTFKSLRRMKASLVPEDAAFATGMWIFFLVLLLRNWFGGPIWLGTGMENFSTLVVLMLSLACLPTVNPTCVLPADDVK